MKKDIKIAITGAGGFLGASAIDYFAPLSHISQIRVLYSKPELVHQPHEKVWTFIGDITNREITRDLIHGCDAILHFANRGIPADPAFKAAEYLQSSVNVMGCLLEAMVEEKVPRILFSSTGGAIYRNDNLRRVPFHELSEIEFRSAYGLAKITNENLLHYYKKVHGISPVILRLSNPFGIRQVGERRQGIVGIMLSRVLNNEPVKIFGNLEIVKDFIYVDDVMRVYDGFLQRPEHQGVFNVGSGMGVSLREVVTNIERVTHKKVQLNFASFNPSDSAWTVLNTSKLQRTINWTCRNSLQDGIRLLWNRFQETQGIQEPQKKAA